MTSGSTLADESEVDNTNLPERLPSIISQDISSIILNSSMQPTGKTEANRISSDQTDPLCARRYNFRKTTRCRSQHPTSDPDGPDHYH